MLRYARHIEETLEKLTSDKKRQDDKRKESQEVIRTHQFFIEKKELLIQKEFQEIDNLQESIIILAKVLENLWNELRSAEDKFKKAVSRQASGCRFEDILQFVSMVGTVVATAGTATVFTISAINEIKKMNSTSFPKDWFKDKDLKPLAKEVELAGNNIKEFTDKYQSKKKNIDILFSNHENDDPSAFMSENLSNDYLKFIIKKEDFNREIQPFLNLIEARKYKQLIDIFLSTAETRNNKIIEYDEKINRILDIKSSIESDRIEIANISNMTEYNFELPLVVSFLQRSLKRIKWDIMHSLTSLTKTLEYLNLEPIYISMDDRTIASLEVSMADIINK